MLSILVQSLLCFQIAVELGLWWAEASAGRGRQGEKGRQQAGSSTPNTVRVSWEEREKEKPGEEMGRKGSSDKEGQKKRDASPGPEDDNKCRVCRFPLLVALFQLLLGVAVTVLAFLMLAISPSLLLRETPHWAGIIVSSNSTALTATVVLCLHEIWASYFYNFCMTVSYINQCLPTRCISKLAPITLVSQHLSVCMEKHWHSHVLVHFCRVHLRVHTTVSSQLHIHACPTNPKHHSTPPSNQTSQQHPNTLWLQIWCVDREVKFECAQS